MNAPATIKRTATVEHNANRCFHERWLRAGHTRAVASAYRPPATAPIPTTSPTTAPMIAGSKNPVAPTTGTMMAAPVVPPSAAAVDNSLPTQSMEPTRTHNDCCGHARDDYICRRVCGHLTGYGTFRYCTSASRPSRLPLDGLFQPGLWGKGIGYE